MINISRLDRRRLTSGVVQAKFGVGYNLSMTRSSAACSDTAVSELVRKYVPQAILLSSAGGEMAFQLPLTNKGAFAQLFQELEQEKEQLYIGGYGVSMTTLEEVFLSLAGDGAASDDLILTTNGSDKTTTPGQNEDAAEQIGTAHQNGVQNKRSPNSIANGSQNAHDVVIPVSGRRFTSKVRPARFGRAFGQMLKKRLLIARRDVKVLLLPPPCNNFRGALTLESVFVL